MMVAGMAAEQILFGCYDDGASGGEGSDLHEATRIAVTLLERSYRMGRID